MQIYIGLNKRASLHFQEKIKRSFINDLNFVPSLMLENIYSLEFS